MFVNQVEWIPLVVILNSVGLRLAISVESLIEQLIHVQIEVLGETLGLHVVASVPVEVKVVFVTSNLLKSLHNLCTLQIALSAVSQDADTFGLVSEG